MSATGSDRPLTTDCARCPLRLPLPDQLSDAAVAQLVESLYLFATAIENGCYSRLRRYYASQREHGQLHDPPPTAAAVHQDLGDDDLPF